MITGLMARFTAFFNCWQQWGKWRRWIPNSIVQWINVAALCVHCFDMRRVVHNRCDCLILLFSAALLIIASRIGNETRSPVLLLRCATVGVIGLLEAAWNQSTLH